jgi:hypothetical protein
MHANAPDPRKKTWQDRLMRSSYFLGAVLFHLILFLMVATLVIWKAPPPPPTDVFHGVAVKPPPPPVQPPSSGATAANPQFEPQPVVVPVVTPMSTITSVNSTFSVDASKVVDQTLSHLSDQVAQGTGLSSGGGGTTGTGSAFGSFTGTSYQLAGYFYDLKQTPDHQPTGMNQGGMCSTLHDFCRQGWNEDDLATRFLKSPKQLYNNEILVPIVFSIEGPKAFGMGDVCQPGFWVAIYHVKVSPAHTGYYHLAGYGDDFLIVRINGDAVLDSGWYSPVTSSHATQSYDPTWAPPEIESLKNADKRTPYYRTVVGDRFYMASGDTMTIDVLIGDADPTGGQGRCGYSIFLVEDGKDYPKDPTGFPIFPLLQIQSDANVKRDGIYPPFSCKPEDALMQP